MAKTPVWMFVASYQEWLNWVETGRIRCYRSRIVPQNGLKSDDYFAVLMNSAPDVSTVDDQAYVLAKLIANIEDFLDPVSFPTPEDTVWLRLEAVEKFLPLSERGARLIMADAHRAWVRIGEATYQSSWESWSKEVREDVADKRGNMMVKTMGLPTPDTSITPAIIQPYLTSNHKPPVRQYEQLKPTRALAWCRAFSVFSMLAEKHKANQDKKLGINNQLKLLREDKNTKEPITKDKKMLSIANKLDVVVKKECGSVVPMRFLATVFHYQEMNYQGKEVELKSLVYDITEVASKHGTTFAANTTYYIGLKMKDVEVTKLYYASRPKDFPALTPGLIPYPMEVTIKAKKTKKKSKLQPRKKKAKSKSGSAVKAKDGKGKSKKSKKGGIKRKSANTGSKHGQSELFSKKKKGTKP